MATFEVVLTQAMGIVECGMTFHFNNITMPAGVGTAPAELAAQFETNWLPAILAVQSSLVSTVSIYARDLGNPATAVTVFNTDPGAIAGSNADTMAPHLPLLITYNQGAWVDVVSAAPYVGVRPGGRGKNYLSGLMEDWQNAASVAIPAALTTEWALIVTRLTGTITLPTGGYVLNHVTWSPAKSALGGLPARNPLIADVTGVNLRYFTKLKSRLT